MPKLKHSIQLLTLKMKAYSIDPRSVTDTYISKLLLQAREVECLTMTYTLQQAMI